MKREMDDYKDFMEEVGEGKLKDFCVEELGAMGLLKMFQMPRSEVTDILNSRYSACAAFGTIMCAVVEQVANFKMTRYDADSRGDEELLLEKALKYDRFGGFVLDIAKEKEESDNDDGDDLEVNQETLDVFMSVMKSLGGPKLLHRGPSTSNQDDGEEGGADDAAKDGKGSKGPSFRSDRRIARLIIARYWADQIIVKYKASCKTE